MGLGDFFRRRAQRESAIPASETELQPLGSFASGEGQPVIGQQVGGAPAQQFSGNLTDMPGMMESLAALSQLGPMIQQAMQSGQMTQNPDGSFQIDATNIQVEGDAPQVLDMRGSGLREEILEIMGQHGIDVDNPSAQGQSIDPSTLPGVQQQILEALAKHGIDPSAGGQIQGPEKD